MLSGLLSQNAIIPGYDIYARPWYWSDDARRMQTVVVGQSGSGKTTLLHNIASSGHSQDGQRAALASDHF